jgi:gliding motility-associated-like protein
VNDLFKVSVIRPCDTYALEIYNRWGERVYETEDAAFAKWDGTHGGKNVESGIYIVVLKGSSFQKKAKLVLIR